MVILVVGTAVSLLGIRHQARAGRVVCGVKGNWYGGGSWSFVGFAGVRAVGMGMVHIAGFWAWRCGSCGDAGDFCMMLSVVTLAFGAKRKGKSYLALVTGSLTLTAKSPS
jgi:hypothetical protein